MIGAESGQETLSGRAAALFRSFRSGDEPAMAELVGLLTPILWHTVRAQRLDRESAEDVVQSTWLALVRNSDSIADPQAVLAWLIVTAKRESWRVAKRTDRVEPKDFDDDDVVTPAARTARRAGARSPTPKRGCGSTSRNCPNVARPCCA